jgi:hypothetical protein
MVAGLPWTAWLLMGTAVVPALMLVSVFYFAHRKKKGEG